MEKCDDSDENNVTTIIVKLMIIIKISNCGEYSNADGDMLTVSIFCTVR